MLLTCASVFLNTSYGQVFKNFREANGTLLSSTLGITQDRQGFMWFGTEAGLYRYNGRTFNLYRADKQANPDHVRHLLTDPDGNIWVASTVSGVYRYQPDKDTFTSFRYDSTDVHSLSHNSVNCLLIDQKKQIWVGTQDGLSRMTNNQGKIRITRHLQSELSGQTKYIRSLTEDKAGNIWMATGDGLVKMKNDGSNPKLFRIPPENAQVQIRELIFVFADNAGIIWLGTNGGLYQFNPGTETFKLVPLKTPGGELPRASRIVADGKGRYWMATVSGLVHFDPLTLQADWYTNKPGDPNSLGNTSVFSLYLDRQGGLWCGSFYAGVSYLHFDSPRYKSWPFATDDLRSRSFSNAWLGKGQTGQIWTISDDQEKLLVFDSHGNNPSAFNLKLSKGADYYSIYLDEKDVLWAAGYSVLTSFNLRTGKYQHYPLTEEGKSEPVNSRTFAIFIDSRKRFWIGGYYGLLLFDQARGKFIGQAIPGISVRSLFEDSRHTIWIGAANEIYRIRSPNSTSQTPPLEKISVDPKMAEYVWRITEDRSGNIWAAGTASLLAYDPKKNRFEPNTDVPGGYIKDVVPDNQGYLWLNGTHRLYRYHPRNRTLQSYGSDAGLPQSGNLLQGAGTVDAGGKLYFASNAGMFSVDPAAIAVNDETSPLLLTSLKLYNREVATGDSTGLLSEPLWKTKEITFRHDQSIFTIDFALLDYVRSGHNKYAYKIDGIDRDWNYVENPSATYTNLPSGTYTFQVKAANGDGFWVRKPLQLAITVLPPWWKTWYARLFYLLAAAGAIYAVNRFFWLRSSFRKENALNQIKLDFFTNVSHEIRTHLSLISGPLEKAYEQLNDGGNAVQNVSYARNNADRLMLLVNELLDFRKIQSGGTRLFVYEHDVVKVVKSVAAAFEHIGRDKEIATSLIYPDTPVLLWFDIAQMQKVFYNLLSNAYKFTPDGGKVSVCISEMSDEVSISVEDTGTGISPGHLQKLFTYYYQADSAKPGYGIGLALSKGIVEQHHGHLTAESRLAAGSVAGKTTLTIRLRRDNRHFRPDQISAKNGGNVTRVFPEQVAVQAAARTAGDGLRNTILIVEDNDELRAFICELFDGGFTTMEAENGRRGLELANEHIPDIILCDIMMPEMNGLEVCRTLKGNVNTAHIPVVLLTARTQNEQVIEGLAAGADDYLAKPFDPRIILLKINNLIRLRDDLKERCRQVLAEPETDSDIRRDVNEAFIARLRGFVRERLSDTDFGVNELAVLAGMSVSVLYRKIRSLTGMTINEFIKTIRLHEARKLLESGVYQVSEVAILIGFEDAKYFSREFTRVFNQKPNEIRKQHAGQ